MSLGVANKKGGGGINARLLEPALDQAAEAAAIWASEGLDTTMNRFNQKNRPQKAAKASDNAGPNE